MVQCHEYLTFVVREFETTYRHIVFQYQSLRGCASVVDCSDLMGRVLGQQVGLVLWSLHCVL